MNRKGIGGLGNGKDPPDLLLRRGQQEITTAVTRVTTRARKGGHAAGVDERQASEIGDDHTTAASRRQCGRDRCRVHDTKFPAQRNDGPRPRSLVVSCTLNMGAAELAIQLPQCDSEGKSANYLLRTPAAEEIRASPEGP